MLPFWVQSEPPKSTSQASNGTSTFSRCNVLVLLLKWLVGNVFRVEVFVHEDEIAQIGNVEQNKAQACHVKYLRRLDKGKLPWFTMWPRKAAKFNITIQARLFHLQFNCWRLHVECRVESSYFFLLFGVSPTFSYFRVKFLLFPTFLGFYLN